MLMHILWDAIIELLIKCYVTTIWLLFFNTFIYLQTSLSYSILTWTLHLIRNIKTIVFV